MSDPAHEIPAVLAALRPYLPDIVLIGGWVPELYRRYGSLSWEGRLSRTTELDLLVHSPLPAGDRPTLRAILEGAGLRKATDTPFPAVWVDADDEHAVVEFLMPNPGPAKGGSVRQVDGQGWLGAVVLQDVELLRTFTTTLNVKVQGGDVAVVVPSLGAYALSKGLSFGGRSPHIAASTREDKRAKDLVYLHDVMMAGALARERVRSDLAVIAESGTFGAVARRAADSLKPVAAARAGKLLHEAGGMLATRERGMTATVALSRIRGAVIDLREMVGETLGEPA